MADEDKRPYHERYRPAPPPDYMRYLTAPFTGYWNRQGELARGGLDQADLGARQMQEGNFLEGGINKILGPLGYLSSPINALLPRAETVESLGNQAADYFGADPRLGGAVGLGLLGAAEMAIPGPGGKVKPMGRTLYHGTREEALNLTNDRPLYLTPQEAEAMGYAKGGHLGGTGEGSPQVLKYQAQEGKTLNIDDDIFAAMDSGDDLDAAINQAAQRAKGEGYRYLEYTHPSFEPGQEQSVVVSLYPKDDLSGNSPQGITAYHGSPQGGTIGVSKAEGAPLSKVKDDYAGEHGSPGPNSGSPLHDVTSNGTYPADFYSHNGLRYYGTGDDALDAATYSKIAAMKNNPDAMVRVWRAVPWDGKGKRPTSLGGKHLNPGDWVTISREYATEHGESALNGNYALIATNRPARELFTAGDSFHEWGWHPAKPDVVK